MHKKIKTIGIIGISVVLGAFVLVRVKEKVDDFNQSPTKQMWDLYEENEKISQTPLKELLSQEITDTTIDEVYLRLCDLCEDGYKLDQINEYQRNFWLVYNFNGETGNGGIEQFLYNCHDQVDITLQTLQDVHLENSTRYLAESKEIYPEKIEMYSNDEITEKLNQKDDTYYDESEKECYTFLFQYLKENKEHFLKES